MELEKILVNDKITVFLSNKYYISQALYQPLETTKMNFEKLLANRFSKTIDCNAFQSSSSLSIPVSFYLLLIFARWFLCFTKFGVSSRCLNFDKFRDTTAPLKSFCFLSCRFVTTNWVRVIEALIVSTLSATSAFVLIYFYHDCKPIGAANITRPLQVLLFIAELHARTSRAP